MRDVSICIATIYNQSHIHTYMQSVRHIETRTFSFTCIDTVVGALSLAHGFIGGRVQFNNMNIVIILYHLFVYMTLVFGTLVWSRALYIVTQHTQCEWNISSVFGSYMHSMRKYTAKWVRHSNRLHEIACDNVCTETETATEMICNQHLIWIY